MLKNKTSYCACLWCFKFKQSFSFSNRSTRPKVFCKKGVLKNFAKFTGKHMCQSLFFNKISLFFNLFKKRPRNRGFPVNFVKFLRRFFHRTPVVATSVVMKNWQLWSSFLLKWRLDEIWIVSFLKIK